MDSLFFNEKEVKKVKPVVEDFTGLLSLVYESEESWNNIERVTLHEEYLSVMNEDKEKLKTSAKAAFKKFVAFFTNLAKNFASVIKNTITRIQASFVKGANYAIANKARISSAKLDNVKDVSVYTWKGGLSSISGSMAGFNANAIVGFVKAGNLKSKDELASSALSGATFESVDKTMISKARNDKKSSKKPSASDVKDALTDVLAIKIVISGIKTAANKNTAVIKAGLTAAKEGLSAGDDKAEVKKAKSNAVATAKNGYAVVNKILNCGIKLLMERYRDSMVIIRAALSSGKSVTKKEKSSNESLFFDFDEEDLNIENEDIDIEENSELDSLLEELNESEEDNELDDLDFNLD